MYYIGICDDEPIFLKCITEMTRDILTEAGIQHSIRTFQSAKALEDHLRIPGAAMDLLLLDIMMKERTGIEFACGLRTGGSQMPIVFITSSMDHVLDGYKAEPLDYLLKPVDPQQLRSALLRAYRRQQDKMVVLSSPSHTVSFQLNNVLYLDIHNKELAIHIADGSILNISVPLNSLISKLPGEQFIQCYRSYIVSLPAIISIWRYGIELKNHETIPLSKTYYAAVQDALMNWASLT